MSVANPSFDRYPDGTDLLNFLEDIGFSTEPSLFRLYTAVLAGIEDLESRCMRHFLAGKHTDNTTEAPYARTYDPPNAPSSGPTGSSGTALDLGPMGDLARIDSVIYQPASAAPESWTAGVDYRPMPRNAAGRGEGVTWLELLRHWWAPTIQAAWDQVEVTGLWGAGFRIPPDVWFAMLENGALALFSAQFRGAGIPMGVKSWTAPDGINVTYDAAMLAARIGQWQQDVTASIVQNGRWSFIG